MKRTAIVALLAIISVVACAKGGKGHQYNGPYEGEYNNRISYPIGGLGTGTFCVEGTGAISNMNIRYRNEMQFEPCMFAAICVKGEEDGCLVVEGQVPDWKKFGQPLSTKGYGGSWGFPRFKDCSFEDRFPFGTIHMSDDLLKVDASLTVWNPFIPTDEDNSSLPVAGFEYTFRNKYKKDIDVVFTYSAQNFIDIRRGGFHISPMANGFVLNQEPTPGEPWNEGRFAIWTDNDDTKVDCCWFRGLSFDPITMAWNDICEGRMRENPEMPGAAGATLSVPLHIKAGGTAKVRLMMAWYYPQSPVREGLEALPEDVPSAPACDEFGNPSAYLAPYQSDRHRPWYAGRFASISEVTDYWTSQYDELREKTCLFTDALYESTLPSEVIEAVAANLTILKSPTVWRQQDGRLWCWEGCGNDFGSCYGSCTHVWNYAQAIAHLFPRMERTLRETEFFVSQRSDGHQAFRSALPIRPIRHNFHAAADGQLGGVMKVYRDWRIYGNDNWLRMLYPYVKSSLDYCIRTWDPAHKGAIEEPHHNTYDIEFWGPSGMVNSYYAGALKAFVEMGGYLGEDVSEYDTLLSSCRSFTENELFDGEYFIQKIECDGLQAPDPTKVQTVNANYSPEGLELLAAEGPKYQYGNGCISDGVVGSWLCSACGLGDCLDSDKVRSHLESVHKYNLRRSLRKHSNPERSTFAVGDEGGLLLCSWPKGGKLKLPFIYANEVWTGIEYQVASHLIMEGELEKGLDIVRTCRNRYDGRVRNPYNEYECGAWYARALSSYSLLQACTGLRYDAVTKTLYLDSRIGKDFSCFLSTETGFGVAGLKKGKPFVDVRYGRIDVEHYTVR